MHDDDTPAKREESRRTAEGLLSPSGIAEHVGRQHGLKVSPGTVKLWVEAGRVPAIMDEEAGLLIDPDEVDRFFERGGPPEANDAHGADRGHG